MSGSENTRSAGPSAAAFQRMGQSLWDAWGAWAEAGAPSGAQGAGPARYAATIDVAEKLVFDTQQVQSDGIELWRTMGHSWYPRAEGRHPGDGLDTMSGWAQALVSMQRAAVNNGFATLRAAEPSPAWYQTSELADPQRMFDLWNEFAGAWIRAMSWPVADGGERAASALGDAKGQSQNAGNSGADTRSETDPQGKRSAGE